MAQLVKKRRPGWVLLVVSALVASLFAVPAAAIDDDSEPNAEAATSACVGDATNDRNFSDVSEGHAFRAAINCLAHYGVTIGYGDGTFGPNNDVSNEEMILFMERAAGIAGADAEAVVGDFAMSGSDPVDRGDMALLIARLLTSATTKDSPVNVTIDDDDGTFEVARLVDGALTAVSEDDWDYFADSRRSLNRVSDSAVSALYETGVAKGTGMGYFSPASTVSRGAMAAFITRALAHTTARPEGVTIQSNAPGEVTISVRDANFHPVANAAVDVFSASTARMDEAFNADGSCYKPRLRPENGGTAANMCLIDALDEPTGLSGDVGPVAIADVSPATGRTVFAWTGESGDKVEEGADGLAHINITEAAPVTAAGTKITTDLGENVERAAFGSTVTVTIQLVGDKASGRANAGPPNDGVTYQIVTRTENVAGVNQASDDLDTALGTVGAGQLVDTKSVKVDASGMATFTITAPDPDPNNADDTEGASVDYVTTTFTVTTAWTGNDWVNEAGSGITDGVGTIRFSDADSVARYATVTPAVKYLAAPATGSVGNAVTVKVVDQYGKPVRNHQVVLTSDAATGSTFPKARRTDSSGTVRIGYSRTGATGVIETITANTAAQGTTAQAALTNGGGGTAMFYWVTTPTVPDGQTTVNVDAVALRVADVEKNIVVIAATGAEPRLLTYDDNDQFAFSTGNTTMEAFEEALAKKDTGDLNTVGVTGYDPDDASKVARFTLTVNGDS